MEVESLAVLKSAFDAWRSTKRHPREAIPGDLLQRASAAARQHGSAAVARATKVARGRLATGRRSRVEGRAAAPVPRYSRLELTAGSVVKPTPFAEVEMPTGLTVRLFTETGEALGLLSSLLGTGGPR